MTVLSKQPKKTKTVGELKWGKKFLLDTDAGYDTVTGKSTHFFNITKAVKNTDKKGKISRCIQSQRIVSFYDNTLDAELYSIECGLEKAEEMNIKNIMIQTDSKFAMYLLRGRDIPKDEFRKKKCERIINKMRKLDATIQYRRRDKNTVADNGCKMARVDARIDPKFRKVWNKGVRNKKVKAQ